MYQMKAFAILMRNMSGFRQINVSFYQIKDFNKDEIFQI